MMILNDIELIGSLRGLQLLKDKEFYISYLFLTDYYLTPVEKQIILDLEKEQKIIVFEIGLEFLKLKDKYSLSNPEASNLCYALQKRLPIITKNKFITSTCKEENIMVYDPCKALKLLNIGDEKIKFIERMLNSENKMIKI